MEWESRIAELESQVRALKQDYEALKGKLRPGSVFVRDLVFKQVVPNKTMPEALVLPVGNSVRGPFDYSDNLELATYLCSARVTDADGDFVEYGGTTIEIAGLSVAYQRYYRAGPPSRLESYLHCYNGFPEDKTVTVKVWRVLSLI